MAERVTVDVINLAVNGKKYKLTFGDDIEPWDVNAYDVYPWHMLAWTLRYKLGLKGLKLGCNRGACGTCTVIMDGRLILSCMTLTAQCDGSEITTIEGLGTPTNLHPIQQAFVENHGSQCGFCAPGMIMATKALLDKNPDPTAEDVKRGLAGNICRCGNYHFITRSVLAAAEKLKGQKGG